MVAKDIDAATLADHSKLPQASIERYANGEGTPTLTKFMKLCTGLEIDPKEFFAKVVGG